MTTLLGALATYLFFPVCLFAGLDRALRLKSSDRIALAASCLGLGPIMAGRLLTIFLATVPSRTDGFYVGTVLALFTLVGLYGILGRKPRWPQLPLGPGLPWPYAVVLAIMALLVAAQAMILPLAGNDPLEYALVAKVLYMSKSLAQYPLRQADPVTGLYASSSHPLGYVSLIIWSYLFSEGRFAWLSKSLSPFFTLATIVLFLVSRRPDRFRHGVLASLILLGTPLYELTSAICHIDSLRLYAMFLSVFCLDRIPIFPERRRWPWIILCGLAAGISLFCHSIGLLTLPFLGACILLRSGQSLGGRLKTITVVCLIALAIGGDRYLENFLEYGVPLRDNEPVWSLPSIDYNAYNNRLKSLVTPLDLVINGLLTPFTRWNDLSDNGLMFFGLSFWLGLLALAWRRRETLADPMAQDCLVCLGGFFAVALASILAGSSLVIKNIRYFQTVLPFVAYLGAIPATFLAVRAAKLRRLPRLLAESGLLLATAGPSLILTGFNVVMVVPYLPALSRGDLFFLSQQSNLLYRSAYYQAVTWVRQKTPPDARILVFRKNEMAYYSGRRILADTDPTLLPFYAVSDPDVAEKILRQQGVAYIYVPNYQPPTFTNSQASSIADDPARSELVFDNQGCRIYRLRQPGESWATAAAEPLVSPGLWTRPATLHPFIQSQLAQISIHIPFLLDSLDSKESIVTRKVPVDPRGIYSGPGPIFLPPPPTSVSPSLRGGMTYRFTATVKGTGWLQAFLLTYPKHGIVAYEPLFDGVLRKNKTQLFRLVFAPKDAGTYRFLFVSGRGDFFTVSWPRLVPLEAVRSQGPAFPSKCHGANGHREIGQVGGVIKP